jgi:hypothetical protein
VRSNRHLVKERREGGSDLESSKSESERPTAQTPKAGRRRLVKERRQEEPQEPQRPTVSSVRLGACQRGH